MKHIRKIVEKQIVIPKTEIVTVVKKASKTILGTRTHMLERNTQSWVML